MKPALVSIQARRVVIGCKWRPEPAKVRNTETGFFWQRNTPGDQMSCDELRLQRALLKK